MRLPPARLAAAGLSAPLLLGALAAPAGASARTADSHARTTSAYTEVEGGATRLTVAPGVAKALAKAGIAVTPKSPASASSVHTKSGATVQFRFPITDGTVDLSKVSGSIEHSGGLSFANKSEKKSITVRSFTVVLGSSPRLTGYVPALKARIPVFNLNLAKAKITTTEDGVRVGNVGAALTATAAEGLNKALGTSVFSAGLKVGTATVSAELDDCA